jgi:hypothetical protein
MFCRNCGKELSPVAEMCMTCGVRPPLGDRFCSSCGVDVSPLAEICVKCGAKMAGGRPSSRGSGKSKSTAVLLAVFLGFWSWLYTYRANKVRFWTGLSVSTPALFLLAYGFGSDNYGLDGSVRIVGSYGAVQVSQWAFVVTLVAFWVWSVVDAAFKDKNWFRSY